MKRVFLLAALFGCSKSERDSWNTLAETVNPILERLRPLATQVRELAGKADARSTAELVALCSKRHDDLQALDAKQKAFFAVQIPEADRSVADVPVVVALLLNEPMGLCRPRADAELCRKSCSEGWNALMAATDRMSELAAKHEVRLVTLR